MNDNALRVISYLVKSHESWGPYSVLLSEKDGGSIKDRFMAAGDANYLLAKIINSL